MVDWMRRRAIELEQKDRHQEAIELWRSMLRRMTLRPQTKDFELANVHFQLGRLHLLSRNPMRAIFHLKHAIRKQPGRAAFYEQFSRAFVMIGHWRASKSQLEKALSIEPKNSSYLRQYSWVLSKMGLQKEAMSALRRAMEIKPFDKSNRWQYVQLLIDAEDWAKAALFLRKMKRMGMYSWKVEAASDFVERKLRVSLLGGVVLYLRKLVRCDGRPFHLGHLRRAQEIWANYCSEQKAKLSKKANVHLIRVWACAVAYLALEKEDPKFLNYLARAHKVEPDEIWAATALIEQESIPEKKAL